MHFFSFKDEDKKRGKEKLSPNNSIKSSTNLPKTPSRAWKNVGNVVDAKKAANRLTSESDSKDEDQKRGKDRLSPNNSKKSTENLPKTPSRAWKDVGNVVDAKMAAKTMTSKPNSFKGSVKSDGNIPLLSYEYFHKLVLAI